MALNVYEDTTSDPYSTSGLFTLPLILGFDGRTGGVVQKKLYLRNDNVLYKYEDITIEAEQVGGDLDYIGGTEGFYFKMRAGDARPTAAEWDTISGGTSISMSDIIDASTYLPFWVYVEVPGHLAVMHIKDVRFKISATESLS